MLNRQSHDRSCRLIFCFTRQDEADPSMCRKVLSPREIQKAMAFRFEKDRILSLISRAQVRYVLSQFSGVAPGALELVAEANGKPRVRSGTPAEHIRFNISHTRGLVASVFSFAPEVGVDVEELGRNANPELARRFFVPEETRQIMAVPEPDRVKSFLKFWTLKEAAMKATGQGLSMSLDKIAFDLSREDRIGFHHGEESLPWQFFSFSPVTGFQAAVAALSSERVSLEAFHCIPFTSVSPITVPVVSSVKLSN